MYAVAVNGSPRKGGNTELLLMFQMSRMIIPGSTYWNMGYGLNKGEVLEDKEGLSNMRHVGKCLDWLGKAIKPDIANYPK
jgi:multimeric flavodoxin WrbA